MSKARQNTTKVASSNAAAVAKMRALVAEMAEAREKFVIASAAFSKVETVYSGLAPKRPEFGVAMPEDVRAAFHSLTVGQLAVIPEDHPYKVWQRDHGATANAKHDAEFSAYAKACDAIKARIGYDKADRAVNRTSERMDRLQRQILATKAEGLEAIALKLLAYRLAEFEAKDPTEYAGLFATIEATAAKAGFNTRAKPVAK